MCVGWVGDHDSRAASDTDPFFYVMSPRLNENLKQTAPTHCPRPLLTPCTLPQARCVPKVLGQPFASVFGILGPAQQAAHPTPFAIALDLTSRFSSSDHEALARLGPGRPPDGQCGGQPRIFLARSAPYNAQVRDGAGFRFHSSDQGRKSPTASDRPPPPLSHTQNRHGRPRRHAEAPPTPSQQRFRDAAGASSRARVPPPPPPLPQPPPQLRIVVTGFGPFQGVSSNPSETLVKQLIGQGESSDKSPLLSSHVLETSAAGALAELEGIHADLTAQGLGNEENLLFVHLGVRHDIEGFRLESVGYNEASFKVPDERAFQPQGQAVSTTNADTNHSLFSTLPLHAMVRALHAAAPAGPGYTRTEVAISSDPGRFVCNYVYFHSLDLCKLRGHAHSAALFVHLPSFATVEEKAQMAFVRELLGVAAAHFPR